MQGSPVEKPCGEMSSEDKPRMEMSSEDKPRMEMPSEDRPCVESSSEGKPCVEKSSEDKPSMETSSVEKAGDAKANADEGRKVSREPGPKASDAGFEGPVAVWAITSGGLRLSGEIAGVVAGSRRFVSAALARRSGAHEGEGDSETPPFETFEKLSDAVARRFGEFAGHIFIMSTGIVVRTIASLMVHKTVDPAVVVVDDRGLHSISLISGHLGGANALALRVAEGIGARPVITTATDVNHAPAIDLIAKSAGLAIENPGAIKHVNRSFLEGEPIAFHDPYNLVLPQVPERYVLKDAQFGQPGSSIEEGAGTARREAKFPGSPREQGEAPGARVYVDDRIADLPEETLVLRPPTLFAGMGCNRGTDMGEMRELLLTVLEENGLALGSLAGLASVDLKHDEVGLLRLTEALNLNIEFFSRDTLSGIGNIQSPSKMVEKHIGVKSVCEAAAILAAGRGSLIVPKRKTRNVTVAIARVPSISSD